MQIELLNPAYAIDLLLLLEGLYSLLVTPHHYFVEFVTWPFLLEQSGIKSFGPIGRTTAESYLNEGQCLIRRCPEIQNSKSFYLTTKNQSGMFQNYLIARLDGDRGYNFASAGPDTSPFLSMKGTVRIFMILKTIA